MKEEIIILKERHKRILETLHEKYRNLETDVIEFTYDGPSNWEIWENQNPKILFLLKEARSAFQPCIPGQKINNKTGRNISRWKNLIKILFYDPEASPSFFSRNIISETNDDIAIIEVKKLNEENYRSSYKIIQNYAMNVEKTVKMTT